MKVSDVMRRSVDFVAPNTSLLDVAKLIFGDKINGLPVCHQRKVVGFISEADILQQFHPTMQEFMEDPFSASNFEDMEKRVQDVLGLRAKAIMNKKPVTISMDQPLLKADSLMRLENVRKLSVVDNKNNLVGIITMGDIFKALVGQKLPFEQDEQFHDWSSRKYDLIVDQKERLSKEIPDLVREFKKANVKSIIDVGSGTGVHSIALAREGFDVLGIDRSKKMIAVALEKTKSLPKDVRQRIKFVFGDYKNLNKLSETKFDAAIFMGSALAHAEDPWGALKEVNKILNKKALIICQITNYIKVIEGNKRFLSFDIRKSPNIEEKELAFLRFFDDVEDGFLTHNLSVYAKGSKRWMFKGMNSMRVYPLTKTKITSFLKKISFSDLKYSGGEKGYFYDYLFKKPFNEAKSDVLVVLAQRK